MPEAKVIAIAGLGGLLPALMWLWFWLREDAKHPEPKYRIAMAFLAGMIAVPLVLLVEVRSLSLFGLSLNSALTFAIWATIEELFKFVACYVAALSRKEMDEPIDGVIYMITTALGFTALENAFFLAQPLMQGNIIETITTGDMRFVGASLLHVLASAAIGVFIAFSFYRRRMIRAEFAAAGVVLASALHTVFNLFIMRESSGTAFATFGLVWLAIIVLMLLFEKIKTINPRKNNA